jgi:hypothetical protein
VGDFSKYGILRVLFQNNPLQLGVNWCQVERDEPYKDGKHITYLNLIGTKSDLEKQFKPCDEELYRKLQQLVDCKYRKIEAVEKNQVLGKETVYYRGELGVINRKGLHKDGLEALEKADVVFFDPDNGLEVKAYPKTRNNHVKYIYYDELADYYNRGQSLIVYQHKDRTPPEEYLERFFSVLENPAFTRPIGKMFLLRFHRFSVRDYFFVLHPEHVEEITQRVSSMIAGNWGAMFDLIELEEARI